jgi:hypothetical protein
MMSMRRLELFKQWHLAERIAVLADHDQPSNIVSVFRAGANAYFLSRWRPVMRLSNRSNGPCWAKPFCRQHYRGFAVMQMMMIVTNAKQQIAVPQKLQERLWRLRTAMCPNIGQGKMYPGVLDWWRLEQGHRSQDQHRRSHRESPRQSNSSQDPRSQSRASGDLRDEQWIAGRGDGGQLACFREAGGSSAALVSSERCPSRGKTDPHYCRL